eukprot:s740_g18.t2
MSFSLVAFTLPLSARHDSVKKSKPARALSVSHLLQRLQRQRCDVKPAEAQQVLASFQMSQQWQHAVHVLRSFQCADSINYGAVLNACARSRRWVVASALALNLKGLGLEVNAILENTLIDSFAPLSWERPLEKLMAMRQQGVSYNRASFGSAFSGSSWQNVMAMLRVATGLDLRPDVITLGSALRSLSERWRTCLDFLLRMRSAASRPNKVCLTSATGSFENWQHALSLSFRGRDGLDDVGLSSLILACKAVWQTAVQLLADARKCKRNKLWDEGAPLAGCVQACSRQRQWETSQQLLSVMQHFSLRKDLSAYGAAFPVVLTSVWSAVVQAVQDSRSSGFSSQHLCSWSSILLVIRDLGAEGSWSTAVSSIEALNRGLFPSDCARSLAQGMCEQSCWSQALALCESSAKEAPSILTLNAALSACRAGGKYELGRSLLGRMIGLIGMVENTENLSVSFNLLLKLCGEDEKLWQEALGLLGEMSRLQVRKTEATFTATCRAFQGDRWPWALWLQARFGELAVEAVQVRTALIHALGTGAQWQWALLQLSKMSDPDLKAYGAALTACERGCEWQRAFLVFQLAQQLHSADLLLFNAAISAADKAENWRLALALMMELEAKLQPDEITLSAVISACSRGAQWQWALAFLAELPSRSIPATGASCSIAFNSAISACERSSQWIRALVLLEDMLRESLPVDEITFNSAISSSARYAFLSSGQPDVQALLGVTSSLRMENLMSMFGAENLDPASIHAQQVIVSEIFRSAEGERALTLGHVLKVYDATIAKHGICGAEKIWRDPKHATVYLKDLAKTSSVKSTTEVLEKMHRQQLQVNVMHFNVAMSARKSRDLWAWAAAVQVFHRMQQEGVLPSIVSFNQLISWLSARWQRALGALSDGALKEAECRPRSTLNAAMSACARRRLWTEALELLMPWPDQVSCGAALSACDEQWQTALMLLSSLPTQIRLYPDVIAYTSLIRACGSCQQWQMALAVLADMDGRVRANEFTFGAVITACANGSQWSTALHMLSALRDQKLLVNEIICSAAISACSKASCWEAALALLSTFRPRSLRLDNLSYNPTIAACAGSETAWDLALLLLQRMPTHSLRSDQYTQTAAAAAMTRPEAAWQWPRALSALGLLKGPWAWEHALLGLSGRDRHAFEAALLSAVSASKATAATATSKQPGSAGPAWRRVMAFFHSLPGLSLRRSCVSFANVAGLRLKWSQSLHIAERMGQVGIPSSIVVQSSVMDSVGAESSRWRLALSIFHRLSRGVQADVVAFCVMSTSFGDASEWGKSLLLHDEQMRQLVTFRTSLTACERGSQWQCGLRLLDASQAAGFHDANSCSTAISACENCGEWEIALELLHAMLRQELRPDSFTLSATISACADSGNWQLAVDLLECMDDWRIPANGICLTAAISACRASAQWQLACNLLQRVALHDFLFDELACTASMGACGQASQWQRATQLLPWLQGYCLQQSEFATDLAGIQIYRALLQWGRHTGNQANARAPLEPILPDAVCWKSNSLPAQAPKAYIPVQAKPTTGPQQAPPAPSAPSLVSVPAVLAQTSPTRQRTRKPSPAESRLKEAGGESVLTGETTASPEEPLTAVAATPEVAAIRQGDKDPGPDLVDLLPTASALVSTSMLPFRSPEEASAWQPRPQPDLGDPGMAILADAFAYRKSLARAVGAWQSAVQDERELVLELRRKQALGYWYRRTRSDMAERAADLARRSSQRRQSLKLGVARWQLCLTARRSFRDRFARLHGFQCRRCLHAAYGSWLLVVHSAKELLAHGMRLARCRVLQACWTALRAYSHQRQLMALYRSWADVHWLRSRLTAAWQAWLRWFRKRGKVVAMRSEQQLLAAWCWLRVHAAGSGCHRRWLPRSSGHTQQRTWWWDPAVDLLFDPAPFEIHPHHMQAVQLTVLRGFVAALLKKMLSSWQMQARATSSFLLKVRLRALSTYLSAWQVQAEEVQRSRACQQEVESLRAGRSRARALKTWSRRCRRQIEHRQRAQDFAADCWHRSRRRAFLAWRIAWDWEAAVLKAQSRAGGRMLGAVMKAWVGLWHYERQEVILLRLSGLFLRKSSLRSGLRQLHVHVGIQARRRALLQAEAQLREAQLRKSWRWLEACWGAWRRQAAHSRLMKLYRSWADVHWLRSRLTAAWQAWLQWFRKRGKVVAMRSAPQLLAAWRWLRVHAACSAHVEFTRRPGHTQVTSAQQEREPRPQLPVDAVAAPWQRVAAELLFGSAPFDIHPHHMQAMRCGLELFATALRQKLLAFWKSEVSRSRDRMQRRKSCMSRRWLWAWKAAAERCRRLHSIKTAVLSFRCRRARRRLLHRWSRRTTQRAECRQRAQDLVLACLRRTCRRALDAWLRARRWQALARRVQKHQLRSQFQAWVAQWQDDRQEATLLRLSALCLRKRSLRMGLLALRSQVRREVALRACRKVRDAAAEARRKLLEVCWMCFVRYAESRRLMKLYRSWADVHWLRSRLTAAWQAWLQWFRKRGKVVAMRSAPQLLAAWRWLRVHAACSAPGRSVRRLQLPTDTTAAAPWQPVAAELLFGSAPFDVHLHHMQEPKGFALLHAMQQSLLILFRSALLKKIFGSWAAKTVGFSRRALERHRRSWLHAWKAQASVGRQLRDRQQSLVAKRLGRSRSLALHSWTTRSQQRVQQRQRACDFKGAIRRRTGRRFLAAWLLLRHEAAATRRRQQRRLSCTLQAWVAQWQDGRQEAALLRLSALCLRRRSLQAGLQALRLQVRRQARRRAHQKALHTSEWVKMSTGICAVDVTDMRRVVPTPESNIERVAFKGPETCCTPPF